MVVAPFDIFLPTERIPRKTFLANAVGEKKYAKELEFTWEIIADPQMNFKNELSHSGEFTIIAL